MRLDNFLYAHVYAAMQIWIYLLAGNWRTNFAKVTRLTKYRDEKIH